MKISVIVVSFNEEKNIGACLESLYNMDYPTEDFEVLVVDGGSKDATIKIIQELQTQHPTLQLIVEPRKGTAIARRVGVEKARYEYVAFTDADCEVPVNWLSVLKAGFKKYFVLNTHLVAVGGRNESPEGASRFLQAMTIALNTFIGSFGSVQGKRYSADREVDSLATLNVLYDKKRLFAVGNFDEQLLSDGEDADMNFRLKQAGFSFMYLADSLVYHKYRPTLQTWAKNMIRYGRARSKLLKKHGTKMWNVLYLLPPLFLLSFLAVPFTVLHSIFLVPLLYFLFMLFYCGYLAYKNGCISLIILIFEIFVITHFCYAFGMLKELLERP